MPLTRGSPLSPLQHPHELFHRDRFGIRAGLELHAGRLGAAALVAHVKLRRRGVADADRHQPRLPALLGQRLRLLRRLGANRCRDGLAVDHCRAHGALPFHSPRARASRAIDHSISSRHSRSTICSSRSCARAAARTWAITASTRAPIGAGNPSACLSTTARSIYARPRRQQRDQVRVKRVDGRAQPGHGGAGFGRAHGGACSCRTGINLDDRPTARAPGPPCVRKAPRCRRRR